MIIVKPFVLTRRMEEILKTLHFYRYMTALDVTILFYSVSSLAYVRKILASLTNAKYLYCFKLPHVGSGNTENIFTLASRGREFLVHQGLPVDWYFRPSKAGHLSYSQIVHNLVLTRFCVAASVWAAKHPDFKLLQTRTCYELARIDHIPDATKKVIPDAWLLFEKLKGGVHEHYSPVLLEIDRGSEYAKKFKHHLRSRLEFIRKGGAYSKLFGQEAVTVAYVTTGEMPQYKEVRRQTMCTWTGEVLKELGKTNWSPIFRFTSVVLDDLYESPIFDEPVWYRPDSPSPAPIFEL